MSWGSTAFTPIITYNAPPFGFEEKPNPSDFPTCPDDPYVGTENLKNKIKEAATDEKEFFYLENNSDQINSHKDDNDHNYNYKTKCISCYALLIVVLFFVYYYRNR